MIRSPFITVLCFLILSAVSFGADGASVLSAEDLKVAQQVHDIFEAKCLDCHGPELPRPKGKFGYVLDLKRIADNPKFVTRGKPDDSDIYTLVRDDEMPGDDANVPPLTAQEKDTVKRWVALGAPASPMASTAAAKEAPVEVSEGGPELPFWKHAIRLLGRLHPVSTHFPVALMYVAVLAEAFAWWSKRDSWLHTVRFLVIIAALGALVAASLGWVNASFTSYVGSSAAVLKWHRWLGTGTAVWTAVCAGLALVSECPEGSSERTRFRGALMFGAALVGISGFLGSALIYGLDHYKW